jgi:hypothetical protein
VTLDEAIAALEVRRREEREYRATTGRVLAASLAGLDPHARTPEEWAADVLAHLDPGPLPDRSELTAKRLAACAACLDALRARLPTRR